MDFKKISHFFQKNINYLILITLALIIFSITFGSSLLEMLRLIKTKNDITTQIAQGEELSSQLDEEIAQIGTQSYIERIARQYLELYYPNEQIVIPVENTYKNQENQSAGQEENPTQPAQETQTETEEVPDQTVEETPTEEVVEETEVPAEEETVPEEAVEPEANE